MHAGGVSHEIEQDLTALADQGLNWIAFVPGQLGPTPEGCQERAGNGLLLLLSLGATFGRQTAFADELGHPFDRRATRLAQGFMERHVMPHDPSAKLVYPGPTRLDLRAWLEVGGVQFRSRLGIGIRPDCRPWLAVRAAIWAAPCDELRQALLDRYPPLVGPSPCDDCADKPCLDACPVDAHRLTTGRLERCIEQRLLDHSTCTQRCWSRSACPVGADQRYDEPQMRYHYGVSLRVIRDWKAASSL